MASRIRESHLQNLKHMLKLHKCCAQKYLNKNMKLASKRQKMFSVWMEKVSCVWSKFWFLSVFLQMHCTGISQIAHLLLVWTYCLKFF